MEKARPKTWVQYLRAVCEQSEGSDGVHIGPRIVSPRERRSSGEADAGARRHSRERRQHPRIAACYKVRIVTDCAKVIDGLTVNISESGVLVELKEWDQFIKYDLIGIAIFEKNNTDHRKLLGDLASLGVIRRIEEESRRIALTFLRETATYSANSLADKERRGGKFLERRAAASNRLIEKGDEI